MLASFKHQSNVVDFLGKELKKCFALFLILQYIGNFICKSKFKELLIYFLFDQNVSLKVHLLNLLSKRVDKAV
jgi:hypothetical protein